MASIHSKIEEYLGRTPDWINEVYVFDYQDGNGPFIHTWNIGNKAKPTTEQLDALDGNAAARDAAKELENLRIERNRKLAETDWWASSDLAMTQAQTDYRQALRDITNSYTSLDDVVWPTKP